MRTLFFMMFVAILAGLAGCQQQEKAKPADTSQVVEEPAPAKESAATDMAKPVETKVVSATVKSEANGQAESAGEMAKGTSESVASSQEQTAAAPAKEMTTTTVVAEVAGNAAKGAKIAKGKCGACHYFDKDKKKVGPTLKGVYNRAPAIEGVPYAKWDEQALNAWLTSPKAVKPKTKMAFKGIPEKDKRDDLIAYLKTL